MNLTHDQCQAWEEEIESLKEANKVLRVALDETRKLLPSDQSGFACLFCDMGDSGRSSRGQGSHDDDCFFYSSAMALAKADEIMGEKK